MCDSHEMSPSDNGGVMSSRLSLNRHGLKLGWCLTCPHAIRSIVLAIAAEFPSSVKGHIDNPIKVV